VGAVPTVLGVEKLDERPGTSTDPAAVLHGALITDPVP
jgi:hypothetical protein